MIEPVSRHDDFPQGGPEGSFHCGAHAEFKERLDKRWEDFTERQYEINAAIFKKIDDMISQMNKISNKLSIVAGGLLIIYPLIQFFMHALWTAKGIGK